MATQNDVIGLAYRRLGMGMPNDAITGDESALGIQLMAAIFAEVRGETVPTTIWTTVDPVPDAIQIKVADFLAAELAGTFDVTPKMSRAAAKLRLMAELYLDDRAAVDPEYY